MNVTRDDALATLAEGNRALAALFARLDDEAFEAPRTIGGGDWSAKDLMAHIAFWEELALEAVDAWRAGRRPHVEAIFDGGSAGIDAANLENQQGARGASAADVRARARRAHEAIAATIAGLTDADWASPATYPAERRRTLVSLLGSVLGAPQRPFGHASAHLGDLDAYVSSR